MENINFKPYYFRSETPYCGVCLPVCLPVCLFVCLSSQHIWTDFFGNSESKEESSDIRFSPRVALILNDCRTSNVYLNIIFFPIQLNNKIHTHIYIYIYNDNIKKDSMVKVGGQCLIRLFNY